MFARFQWWAPWNTRAVLPRVFLGCDEWHNKSIGIILPLLGGFIVFYERSFDRSGPEHLYGYSNGRWEGKYEPTCEICAEIMADIGFRT